MLKKLNLILTLLHFIVVIVSIGIIIYLYLFLGCSLSFDYPLYSVPYYHIIDTIHLAGYIGWIYGVFAILFYLIKISFKKLKKRKIENIEKKNINLLCVNIRYFIILYNCNIILDGRLNQRILNT